MFALLPLIAGTVSANPVLTHRVFLDSEPWRYKTNEVQSNFVALSMEYSKNSMYYAFEHNETAPRIAELINDLQVGDQPLLVRMGGNSVMKTAYADSEYTYPENVYLSGTMESETFSMMSTFAKNTGAQYIVAMPMIDPDPKYALEWVDAVVDAMESTDYLYALELGNEPDHWGDQSKEDKKHLLDNRVQTPTHGTQEIRYAYEDYMEEINNVMMPAIKASSFNNVKIQGPASAGTNTNNWHNWNDYMSDFHLEMQNSNTPHITAFHRYGMSGFSSQASMDKFMSDPPTDGTDEDRNTMEWIGKVATEITNDGGEFVHGEGNTVTGSGRSLLEELKGMDRSYEAGVWMFNNLLEFASRNVTRSHVHGLCGSSFAPIRVPYLAEDKESEHYLKIQVTPIFTAMMAFNSLITEHTRISVPAAFIGNGLSDQPMNAVEASPYFKHYLINDDTLVYINKHLSLDLNVVLDPTFCATEMSVKRMTRVEQSGTHSNQYDQTTAALDGLWYDHVGDLQGTEDNELLQPGEDLLVSAVTAVIIKCKQ